MFKQDSKTFIRTPKLEDFIAELRSLRSTYKLDLPKPRPHSPTKSSRYLKLELERIRHVVAQSSSFTSTPFVATDNAKLCINYYLTLLARFFIPKIDQALLLDSESGLSSRIFQSQLDLDFANITVPNWDEVAVKSLQTLGVNAFNCSLDQYIKQSPMKFSIIFLDFENALFKNFKSIDLIFAKLASYSLPCILGITFAQGKEVLNGTLKDNSDFIFLLGQRHNISVHKDQIFKYRRSNRRGRKVIFCSWILNVDTKKISEWEGAFHVLNFRNALTSLQFPNTCESFRQWRGKEIQAKGLIVDIKESELLRK